MDRRRFLGGALAVSSSFFLPDVVSSQDVVKRDRSLKKLVERLKNVPGDDKVHKKTMYAQGLYDRHGIWMKSKPGPRIKGNVLFHFGIEGIEKTKNAELVGRIHKFLDYVYPDKIRARVELMGEEDLADDNAEYGGLILEDYYMPFHAVRSNIPRTIRYKNKLGALVSELMPSSNGRYRIDERFLNTPHLGEFHMHFVNPHGHENLHPSGAYNPVFKTHFSGDIGYSLQRILDRGSNHQIVITKVKDTETVNIPPVGKVDIEFRKPAMNFKYFGGYKEMGKEGDGVNLHMYVVNLGTFEVEKHYKEKK